MSRALKLLAAASTIALVAFSSTSYSAYVLTFKEPVADINVAKAKVERLASVNGQDGGPILLSVTVIDSSHLRISYAQVRPGCSSKPEVDGSINAVDAAKNALEAEYGPISIEQRHSANKDVPN